MPFHQTHDLVFGATTVSKRYRSWERGEHDREWAGLTLLAEHAPGLAPRPLRREVAADGSPVVVMSRLAGSPLGADRLTPDLVVALGAAVRALHGVPVEAVEAAGLGERTLGPSTMRTHIRDWAAQEVDLGACRHGAVVADALRAARQWLAEPAVGLDRVVDPVLGLADGNAANVLWDGSACRVVDLEDCGLSDPAFEVAGVVEHASFRLPRLVEPERVAAAAGLDDAQWRRWTAYRPLFAALWLVMLVPGNRGFVRNPVGSTEDQARHLLTLLG